MFTRPFWILLQIDTKMLSVFLGLQFMEKGV
jgi:hypothetical protein